MTPHEKVVEILMDAVGDYLIRQYGKSYGLHHPVDRKRIIDAIPRDTILAALASSSGDHAELARLAARCDLIAESSEPHDPEWFDSSDHVCAKAAAGLRALIAEIAALQTACSKSNDEICQVLGKALGYPWFKDDPKNFPDATEDNGVCVGDHVAESLVDEAARRITEAERKLAEADREISARRGGMRSLEIRRDFYKHNMQRSEDRATEAERKLGDGSRSWTASAIRRGQRVNVDAAPSFQARRPNVGEANTSFGWAVLYPHDRGFASPGAPAVDSVSLTREYAMQQFVARWRTDDHEGLSHAAVWQRAYRRGWRLSRVAITPAFGARQ